MTCDQLRAQVVALAKSRLQKNQYSQAADKRNKVDSGYSDCSSFVRWCYSKLCGQDIGSYTGAQVQNKALAVVDKSAVAVPDEGKLLPGDLLYFKGSDATRPLGVGHVEMYIGNGQLIGHGSGIGPTVKPMAAYCRSRASSNRGYLRTLRVIGEDAGEGDGKRVVATGDCNVRVGPGVEYEAIGVLLKGQERGLVEGTGWRMVRHEGRVGFVSEGYTKVGGV